VSSKPPAELAAIRQWAREKIDAGSEPPWAWYQYMKLIDAIDAITQGMSVTTTENSPQSEERPERRLRLVEATCSQDTSPHRLDKTKLRMPM